MSHSILIVEDEEKLAALLSDYLHKSSFVTHWLVWRSSRRSGRFPRCR
jgi:DNA-binding response OmpR family regulator